MDRISHQKHERVDGNFRLAEQRWIWTLTLFWGGVWLLVLYLDVLPILFAMYSPIINKPVDAALCWFAGLNQSAQYAAAVMMIVVSLRRLRRISASEHPSR
jgi:hypothetical protein